MDGHEKKELGLAEAVTHLLEECRMVLPGVQALFGFQLIAVFNASFAEKLTSAEQRLHLLALALVAISGALVMAPAAFHRQTGPRKVSDTFLNLASRLLLWAMSPLMLGIALDFYLIGRIILGSRIASGLAALGLIAVFSCLWFVLPRAAFLHRAIAGSR